MQGGIPVPYGPQARFRWAPGMCHNNPTKVFIKFEVTKVYGH